MTGVDLSARVAMAGHLGGHGRAPASSTPGAMKTVAMAGHLGGHGRMLSFGRTIGSPSTSQWLATWVDMAGPDSPPWSWSTGWSQWLATWVDMAGRVRSTMCGRGERPSQWLATWVDMAGGRAATGWGPCILSQWLATWVDMAGSKEGNSSEVP